MHGDFIWTSLTRDIREDPGSRYWIESVKSISRVWVSVIHALWSTRLLFPWDSPGKNTRVGCHSLLQGDLPDPGIEPRSPNCRQILYHLRPLGSPFPGKSYSEGPGEHGLWGDALQHRTASADSLFLIWVESCWFFIWWVNSDWNLTFWVLRYESLDFI